MANGENIGIYNSAQFTPYISETALDELNDSQKSKIEVKSVTETIAAKYEGLVNIAEIPGVNGTGSIINNYVVFRVARNNTASGKTGYDLNNHYIQNLKESSGKAQVPTAANIIEWASSQEDESNIFGPTPYSWNDFLYCKHYGKIPNNHLLTLRRYPLPVLDNLKGPDGQLLVPIAQAVTWLGEDTGNTLKDILKWTYGYVWKELEASVQEVDGNETQFGSGVEQFAPDKIQKALGLGSVAFNTSNNDWDGRKGVYNEWAKGAYGSQGPYWNRVYGPVNVVHKTYMRDRGLNFSNEINLKFYYRLNSYEKISPKVAMLDVISNFLLLTYSNAKFWGGATRYFPRANKVGFLGDQSKFYSGDYDGYFGSVTKQMSGLFKGGMDFLNKLISNPQEALQSLIKGGVNLGMGNLASKSRPNMLSIRSLLTGEPIGEWHLTVGNPMNPIAVIGNLILKDTSLEFSDKLGAEDFPTEVMFTVKLDHGKPRDKGDIESMLNLGAGRMYYSTLGQMPSERNTFGDGRVDGSIQEKSFETPSTTNANNQQYLNDINVIRNRVAARWGSNFSNNPGLGMFIQSTKTNF